MSVSAPFIQRPIATRLLALGVLLLGLAAWLQMPVSALPTVEFPTILVRAALPGATPETMAGSVAAPLERRLGVIAGLKELTSINSAGASTLVAQFDLSRRVDGVANDVQAAINAASAELPADMPGPPTYIKANPNVFPVFALTLTSASLPPARVYDLADSVLSQRLAQIEGVARVSVNGAAKSALRIRADAAALAVRGLGLDDLRQAIAAATSHLPKGRLQGEARAWTLVSNDQLLRAEDFRDLILRWDGGTALRLGDVAEVSESVADQRVASWYNTRPAVLVEVFKRADANMIETVDAMRAALEQVTDWLPPGIDLHVTHDQTSAVRAALFDLQLTLLGTAALVVVVIGLFLRRRWATRVPALTIPVTLAGTLGLMYLAGFSLDNLSVMALIIAVGFIVDDTIIMVEQIVHRREAGDDPRSAALRGTRQMAFTVISMSVALLAALLPVLFMPEILGRFFREFGATLAFAIVVSALVSLTLTPSLCARHSADDLRAPAGGRLGLALETGMRRLNAAYAASLAQALRRPGALLLLLLASVIASGVLMVQLPKRLLPEQDNGVIRATTAAPASISFEAMRARQRQVVARILADPAVDNVTAFVGTGIATAINNGRITITLRPADQRRASSAEVIERLRPQLAQITGIETYLSLVDDFGAGGRSGRSAYQYSLQGPDLAELQHWAQRLRQTLRGLPELADISSDADANALEARLRIDRDAAARLGISDRLIDQTLYNAFGQRQVATLYDPRDQRRVILEVAPEARRDLAALERVQLPGAAGKPVALSEIARIEPLQTPVQINHQGQLPAITIGFDTAAGVTLGAAMAAIDEAVAKLGLPAQIRGDFAGKAHNTRESSRSQGWLLLASLLTIYLMLGILYESYAHPLTILSTVPSAGLGAMLALWVTGTELSFVAMIGLILLIGIVMKNGILMVDHALAGERKGGLSAHSAIYQAAVRRFRPITMTTLAAVLGALPLAIGIGEGSELRQPLGIAIVGGLAMAQLLTLYTTPAIYLAVNRLRGRRRSRDGGPSAAMA